MPHYVVVMQHLLRILVQSLKWAKKLVFSKYKKVQIKMWLYRGKFVNLENLSCKIKPGCKEHPPWPGGICTKCQPNAVTLNRQVRWMLINQQTCLLEDCELFAISLWNVGLQIGMFKIPSLLLTEIPPYRLRTIWEPFHSGSVSELLAKHGKSADWSFVRHFPALQGRAARNQSCRCCYLRTTTGKAVSSNRLPNTNIS